MSTIHEAARRPSGRQSRIKSRARRVRQTTKTLALGLVLALSTSLPLPSSASGAQPTEDPPACVPESAGGPIFVTPDCVDPQFDRPVIDSQSDVTTPVPHHKVSGHFEGTTKKFTFYFPSKKQWDGRFFQLVYPLQNEDATDEAISFGADSGAYTVQTNGGSGYRADAAAAKFSKKVAADYYSTGRRIYGYIYGGSGGSYQTIGAIENSSGVWDGAVPFIPGVPTSLPNNFFVRAFARFILEDKAPQIADAVSPGGSGNPYAGLSPTERAVLLEVTKMGVPLRAWEDYSYLLGLNDPQGLLSFGSAVRSLDPTYADDFWSKPGYLGTEQSALGERFRAALTDHMASITKVNRGQDGVPASIELGSVPGDSSTWRFDYTVYAADGTTKVGTLAGALNPTTKVFTLGSGNPASVLNAVQTGAKLRMDNRWSLALLSYHRHQVPKRAGFDAWDQFRTSDGTPIYPQRSIEVGPTIARSVTGGGSYSGNIHGKVIMVGNLLDVDAYPWHGDWYRARVKESLGRGYTQQFRVWYNDHADHIGPHSPRLIQSEGIVQQALRDVSVWAENGVTPAKSTRYDVSDGQVNVPGKAVERRGIQPVVDLTVNGSDRIDVTAGNPVTFRGTIQVPPGAGKVVSTAWDFSGTGDFVEQRFGHMSPNVEARATHTYSKPGTYFAALRVTGQRQGDADTPFAQVQNLDRVRVVVH